MWKSVDSVDLPGRTCSEDRFGTSGPLAWILDGASTVAPGASVTGATTDAIWIVEHIDSQLRSLCDDPRPLRELVTEALANLARAADDEWLTTPEVPPSAALGVVRHAGDHVEFLVLADVSVILRAEPGAQWFIDRRVDEHNRPAAEAMGEALRDPAVSFDEAIERTRPYLARPRRLAMNQPDGYWVASTDPTAAAHALTGALRDVDEVVLASDGFMRGLDLFGLVPDPDALFDCDFGELAAAIRRVEHGPRSREFPRWSISDDICAHRLRWVD
jgi:hypothetical protein